MSPTPAQDKREAPGSREPRNVAKPNAGHPAAVPDHAFEASIAGEEDPGASLDNNANGVPPPKDTRPASVPPEKSSGASAPQRPQSRPGSPD